FIFRTDLKIYLPVEERFFADPKTLEALEPLEPLEPLFRKHHSPNDPFTFLSGFHNPKRVILSFSPRIYKIIIITTSRVSALATRKNSPGLCFRGQANDHSPAWTMCFL